MGDWPEHEVAKSCERAKSCRKPAKPCDIDWWAGNREFEPMKLVMFDIDGTLTETSEVDEACFVQALCETFHFGTGSLAHEIPSGIRSNTDHEPICGMGNLAFFDQLNKRLSVEYPADGVSHFLHDQTDATGAFVWAIWTWAVCTLADAIDWRQRAVGDSNDAAKGKFAWRFAQGVAPALAAPTFENSGVPKLEYDRFQKLPRYLFG
jgi:hypothetical protein